MKRTNLTQIVIASLLLGILYNIFFLFIYPNSPAYNPFARKLALVWGCIGMLFILVHVLFFHKKHSTVQEQQYVFMKENRLLPINEYLFLGVIAFLMLTISIQFYNTSEDIFWVLALALSLTTILIFIQYHRGIIKIIKQG